MSMSDDWSALYGDIVWAKFGTFPWWPCIVYDPAKLPSSSQKGVREKAKKLEGKQHVVYFFADKSYGFCIPKNIRLYNEETKAQLAAQSISKKYKDTYVQAIIMADEQSALPKQERLSWHYTASSKEDSSDDECVQQDEASSEEKPKKKGRPPKKRVPAAPQDSNDSELYFEEEPYDEDDEAAIVEGVDDEVEEEEASQDDSQGSESEFGAIVGDDKGKGDAKKRQIRRGQGRKRKAASLPSRQSNLQNTQLKQARSSSGASAKASSAAPAAPAERPMPEESLVDRLTRFSGILRQCAAEGPARDLDRVIRVLDKLDKVRVTGADLIKSGVGKTVAELRRHASPGISDRAGALRKLWTAVVLQDQENLQATTPAAGVGEVSSAAASSNGSGAGSSSVKPATATAAAAVGEVRAWSGAGSALETPDAGTAPAPASGPSSGPSSGPGAQQGQGQVRARAVRLLREASVQCAVPGINSGELAFALEKAVMEAFGAGQPRYFEFISRVASQLKNDAHMTRVAGLVRDGQVRSLVSSNFDLVSA